MGKTKTKWVERPGGRQVGRFHVEVELANNDDLALARRGKLGKDQVRRTSIAGVIDSGAASLVLPQAVAEELGLTIKGKVRVRYANGRIALRDNAEGVFVAIQGRSAVFTAVLEPKRDTALIGAIILEQFDLFVDCKNQRLVPRDPDFELYEIE